MLLNATEKCGNGSEMPKKAFCSEMVRDMAKNKCTGASKASPNFSSEEYRQSFRIKRRAFRLVAPNGGLLILYYSLLMTFCVHVFVCMKIKRMLLDQPVECNNNGYNNNTHCYNNNCNNGYNMLINIVCQWLNAIIS